MTEKDKKGGSYHDHKETIQQRIQRIGGNGDAIGSSISGPDIKKRKRFLACPTDRRNRKALATKWINTDLVMSALYSAKQTRGSLAGFIHHTDSDSRYCSDVYTKALKEFDMRISMCVGSAYQNAFAESPNMFEEELKKKEKK